ncbi:hypothetical protein H5410_016638 [Solanum commersonii]|uniref:Uncharacterized protein n=1 Tax=Solanum commersonii TaxID=4109 RepID=A0A9J5ZWX4_SOLCO|nr:hypothetical protein H5410_016638 [Solanum commersonii]
MRWNSIKLHVQTLIPSYDTIAWPNAYLISGGFVGQSGCNNFGGRLMNPRCSMICLKQLNNSENLQPLPFGCAQGNPRSYAIACKSHKRVTRTRQARCDELDPEGKPLAFFH